MRLVAPMLVGALVAALVAGGAFLVGGAPLEMVVGVAILSIVAGAAMGGLAGFLSDRRARSDDADDGDGIGG